MPLAGAPVRIRPQAATISISAATSVGFLKEHRKVEEQDHKIQKQEATIAKQQKDFQATAAHQQKEIEALTAGLQKVSDQLELGKPAPRMVGNDQ